MKAQTVITCFCVLVLCSFFTAVSSYNLVCYFASWAIYRNLSGEFRVSNIDPNLCTHINYAFIELVDNGSIYVPDLWESNGPDDGGHYGEFKNLLKLKTSNPELKILLSLGGWNQGSRNFSIVAADPAKRKILISELLALLTKYDFDGIDIDWEYPTLRDFAHPEDKENFITLLKEFRETLNPNGLILTAALAGAVDKIEAAYDLEQVSELLDMMNIMAYDFHGAFDNFVGHISPLHASPLDYAHGRNSTYTVATGLEYFLYKGADPSKVNLGIATYGRTFTLADKDNTELYAPILGPGEKGQYSGLNGTLSYNEICTFYSGADSTYVWDDNQKVPHRVVDDQWIGFEDERSIQLKVDFAVKQKLGGAMIYALDNDDFLGECGTKYLLTQSIKDRLKYWENKKNQ